MGLLTAAAVVAGAGLACQALAQSALTPPASGLRFSELMYNPTGGDAYEFIEILNTAATATPLAGLSLGGIDYTFPSNAGNLAAGGRLVLASAVNATAFAQRYPGVAVFGVFAGGLSNAGEKLILKDANGAILTSVDYLDGEAWPTKADGGGYSLELTDLTLDPSDPNAWRPSAVPGGTPGKANATGSTASVRINEVLAENQNGVLNGARHPDWVELYNSGTTAVDLGSWSLSDGPIPRRFVFPIGTRIPAQGYLTVWCDADTTSPGLHSGFGLSKSGDAVYLFDASTNRVDGVRFGPQMADRSLARISGQNDGWAVATPTPGAVNQAAAVGSQTRLAINEYVANPLLGEPDWLELYNRDAGLPVDLYGATLTSATTRFRVLSHIVIPPQGFVQLLADEVSQPGHVEFKLPAAGGSIGVFAADGSPADTVTYGPQLAGVSEGRSPDGASSFTQFPATATPGAANAVAGYRGPILNEVMASLGDYKLPSGNKSAWVEIFNPLTTAADLTGMSMSVGAKKPGQWVFPSGTTIRAGGFLIVRCDPSEAETKKVVEEPNTGRGISGSADAVYLFNAAGQDVDSVTFGFQPADWTIGRNSKGWELLAKPTPAAANSEAAALAVASVGRLNEWLPNPSIGASWFELFNPSAQPLALAGTLVAHTPTGGVRETFALPTLSFIAPSGWVQLLADTLVASGFNHVGFQLSPRGGSLSWIQANGTVIDAVNYGALSADVSAGRLPDGSATVALFPGSATPGESNIAIPENLVISELLAHTDPPLEDAIEFQNTGSTPIDIGGWFLSNTPKIPKKYRLPKPSVIPAGGYLVIYENQFNANNSNGTPFTFNSAHGDEAVLCSADSNGNLTGYRLKIGFASSENGVSFGRVTTAGGVDFVAQAGRSFGVDAPPTLDDFRKGTGRANVGPKVGPVVISEVFYSPADAAAGASTTEFLEVHNPTTSAIPLYDPQHPENHWKLQNAVEFEFPSFSVLLPGEFALVVDFDPATDTAASAAFVSRFSLPSSVILYGPFKGHLSSSGESVELYKPDPPQEPPHPDAGYVPYILVEAVNYSKSAPWPVEASTASNSLQRKVVLSYGNDPTNWLGAEPTPGRGVNIPNTAVDSDKDGLPDAWERSYGLDPANAADAGLDSDHDGLTNLQEYQAGTDPKSANSTLRLTSRIGADGALELAFTAQAGKGYLIQRKETLTDAAWTVDTAVEPSTAAKSVSVGARRPGFYRVVLKP